MEIAVSYGVLFWGPIEMAYLILLELPYGLQTWPLGQDPFDRKGKDLILISKLCASMGKSVLVGGPPNQKLLVRAE